MTVGNIPEKQNISDWLKLCKPEKPIEPEKSMNGQTGRNAYELKKILKKHDNFKNEKPTA